MQEKHVKTYTKYYKNIRTHFKPSTPQHRGGGGIIPWEDMKNITKTKENHTKPTTPHHRAGGGDHTMWEEGRTERPRVIYIYMVPPPRGTYAFFFMVKLQRTMPYESVCDSYVCPMLREIKKINWSQFVLTLGLKIEDWRSFGKSCPDSSNHDLCRMGQGMGSGLNIYNI